jgi:hypothetical protein
MPTYYTLTSLEFTFSSCIFRMRERMPVDDSDWGVVLLGVAMESTIAMATMLPI